MQKLRKNQILRKNITLCVFIVACLIVGVVFLTATTYIQLAIATLFYPPLVYFAYKLFPHKIQHTINYNKPAVKVQPVIKTPTNKSEKGSVDIADIDKRAFLKIIGAAGFSFFLYSLFLRRAESFLPGRGTSETGNIALEDSTGNKIDPAKTQPTDGYRISEVDEDKVIFVGFINNKGAWYIMREDIEEGSFRYVRGKSDFTNNWDSRERLKYDYYDIVFP